MRPTLDPIVETRGFLDDARVEPDGLHAWGWVAAVGGEAVDGLRLTVDDRALDLIAVDLGQPSDDVARAHPNLPRGAQARFHARFAWPGGDRADRLYIAEPRIGAAVGNAIVQLVEPGLPVPPKAMLHAIGAGFPAVALEFLGYFIQRAGLEPGDAVLDIGCGVGRMAYGLAYYLGAQGRYEGFDPMPALIAWADGHLTPRRPRFRFTHVDLYNRYYNPRGRVRPESFAFPHADDTFDLAISTSVFTHVPGREVRRYLDEIHRVLRPGGRCLATCFLLGDAARAGIAAGKASQAFRRPYEGDGWSVSRWSPEKSVGFDEALFLDWVAARGFRVLELRPGLWSGRDDASGSYQDMLILEKPR